jgi:hypothetical protein
MQIITEDHPIVYSNASGLRSWTKSRKKRRGFNKALGFIPVVAAARAIQNKRDNNRAMAARRAGSSGKPISGVSPSRTSAPKRVNPNALKTTQSAGKPVKQIVKDLPVNTAYIPQPEQTAMSSGNKWGLIAGGVIILGVVGYFVWKKANKK